MKKMSMLLAALFLVVVSCSDDDDGDEVEKSNAKAITAFTFLANEHDSLSNDVKAVINKTAKTVKAELPKGMSLTKLKPTITVSNKASVSPKSKTEKDFSKPIVYTVTAEDKSTSKYTVTITVKED